MLSPTTSSNPNEPISKSPEDAADVKSAAREIFHTARCKMDENDCFNLQDVLELFNSPASHEQAWALCYQIAKTLSSLCVREFYPMSDLSQILLHKDGYARIDFQANTDDTRVSEQDAVFSLGMLIFKALDFGLDEEEERSLPPDLQTLITTMTEHPQETDDEGIERDARENDLDDFCEVQRSNSFKDGSGTFSLKQVLSICASHVDANSDEADAHYKTVLREYVSEAREFSSFLTKVSQEKFKSNIRKSFTNKHGVRRRALSLQLEALDFSNWTDIRICRAMQARFWAQVIGELKKGVQLRKVDDNESGMPTGGGDKNTEFELTPYESLMDDIRKRRYNLKKVPQDYTRRLNKDARAVLLEYIKSRPILKKATDRQLPPRKQERTLRELLMASIQKPPKLRAVRRLSAIERENMLKRELYNDSNIDMTLRKGSKGSKDSEGTGSDQIRKLISVDFDLKLDSDDDSDDDNDYKISRLEKDESKADDEKADENQVLDRCSSKPWKKDSGRLTKNDYYYFRDSQLESYDLATQYPLRGSSTRANSDKESIALAYPFLASTFLPKTKNRGYKVGPGENMLSPSKIAINTLDVDSNVQQKIEASSEAGKGELESRDEWQDNTSSSQVDPELLGEFLDERLSLTLAEIVHIRSVLTKAELESLPVEGRVKEDVEKRRVCFLCLKTRFGLLGPWGQRCRLCERTVCVRCCSKMRIPTERFSRVPVVLLSPGVLLSPCSENCSENGSPVPKAGWARSVSADCSAPSSPAFQRELRLSATTTGTATTSTTSSTTPRSNSGSPYSTPVRVRRDRDRDHSTERPAFQRRKSPATFGKLNKTGGTEQPLAAERLRGAAVVVCHDCRIMVIQIIKSSRVTRANIRNNIISRLTLNLSPAYV